MKLLSDDDVLDVPVASRDDGLTAGYHVLFTVLPLVV